MARSCAGSRSTARRRAFCTTARGCTGDGGGFLATRYHSLVIEPESLPECLVVTSRTEDGTIMGVRHRELPIEGVQFHPESILTQNGRALLKNFLFGE